MSFRTAINFKHWLLNLHYFLTKLEKGEPQKHHANSSFPSRFVAMTKSGIYY